MIEEWMHLRTEILTDNGWVKFHDYLPVGQLWRIEPDQEIFTYNVKHEFLVMPPDIDNPDERWVYDMSYKLRSACLLRMLFGRVPSWV